MMNSQSKLNLVTFLTSTVLLAVSITLLLETRRNLVSLTTPASLESAGAPLPNCGRSFCNVDVMDIRFGKGSYDGRKISLTGYLVIIDGMLSIFPTELDYANGLTHNSIQVRGKQEAQKALFDKHGYSYVRVMATFHNGDALSRRMGALGILREPIEVLAPPPSHRREEWSDIRIFMDDLEK